jgi:hypothetical protein
MKKKTLTIILIYNFATFFGQITNSDFEKGRDSIPALPNNWGIKKVEGFEFSLDNKNKISGEKSFCLKSALFGETKKFIPFSQIVKFERKQLVRIAISAYIKTKDLNGNAGIWCQIWDKNDKQIGFANLEQLNTIIKGTNEWKKYSLILTVNSSCKKLVLGGYLQGNGSVWYDDFSISELPFSNIPPSKEIKKYIRHFYKLVKTNSIYSDSLDWNTIDEEIKLLSNGLKSLDEAKNISSYILDKLKAAGDHHSFILSKINTEKSVKGNLDDRKPSGKILNNNIGYIYVPGFLSSSDTASRRFSEKIQSIIKELDLNNEIKGWIVDLRENTGGNMYPMIAGLGPLIDNGTLGHFVSSNNKREYKWYYENGKCGAGIGTIVNIKNFYFPKNRNAKIAVLVGSNTASSGEMTTISFIGKSNSKLFGQPTAGLTTANQGFKLSDKSTLLLAVSTVSDRNNKKYLKSINPDIFCEDDKIIYLAENWVLEK